MFKLPVLTQPLPTHPASPHPASPHPPSLSPPTLPLPTHPLSEVRILPVQNTAALQYAVCKKSFWFSFLHKCLVFIHHSFQNFSPSTPPPTNPLRVGKCTKAALPMRSLSVGGGAVTAPSLSSPSLLTHAFFTGSHTICANNHKNNTQNAHSKYPVRNCTAMVHSDEVHHHHFIHSQFI